MATPEQVLKFWLEEVGEDGWYAGGAELDAEITRRFLSVWEDARHRRLEHWRETPQGKLALLLVLDQFPRNMFRDDARAFSTDGMALKLANKAIHRRWDLRIKEPERQFFYLPLMHSECRTDQDRCVRLILTRLPQTGAHNLLHARAHRAVIRSFGRFPYRNAVLGRASTADERAYMEAGGYPVTVQQMRDAA